MPQMAAKVAPSCMGPVRVVVVGGQCYQVGGHSYYSNMEPENEPMEDHFPYTLVVWGSMLVCRGVGTFFFHL